MRLHAAYAVPHYACTLWKHQRRFKHTTFFCSPAALFITHPAQKHDRNQVCVNIIGRQIWGVLFHLARRAQKRGHLPPHCLVGELAHPIELLLHFVFSFLSFNAYWGVIFRIISLGVTVRAPRRRSAESALTCFPLPSWQAADSGSIPPLHLFLCNENWTSTFVPPLPAQGCRTQFTAGTHRERQRRQVAAAQQCSVGNVV